MCFGAFSFFMPLLTERDTYETEAINMLLLRSKNPRFQ